MSMRSGRWWIPSLVLALAVTAGTAQAFDLAITVPKNKVRTKIKNAIAGYLASSPFEWLPGTVTVVETQSVGASDTTLHVTLKLEFVPEVLPVAVPVDVDFDIDFLCNASGPFARIDETTVTAGFGQSVPPNVAEQIEAEANLLIAERQESIVAPIWEQIAAIAKEGYQNKVCPHFEISPQGDLYAEVDFASGCINGKTKYTSCQPPKTGPGRNFICENGRWKFVSGHCLADGASLP